MPRKKPIVPLMLRLPGELHKRIAHEADKASRSLNQELVRRLEESFRHEAGDRILEAIGRAHDERSQQVQAAFADLQALSKDVDARMKELAKREHVIQALEARLTETLEAGIKK
jgi:Arc-like DNA binding domain